MRANPKQGRLWEGHIKECVKKKQNKHNKQCCLFIMSVLQAHFSYITAVLYALHNHSFEATPTVSQHSIPFIFYGLCSKMSLSGAGATPTNYRKLWLLVLSVSAQSSAHPEQNPSSLQQTIFLSKWQMSSLTRLLMNIAILCIFCSPTALQRLR